MLAGMGSLLRLLAVIVVTAILLAVFTEYQPGTLTSSTRILGLPVVAIAQVGAVGWLGMGQAAGGVLVIAQGGAGVVTIAQGGFGLFFGIGQVMFGLTAIAQGGIGPFFFVGQVGLGAQARGQAVYKERSREYFAELVEEMSAVLSFRGRA
jgi:hypothetical protein